eukprot:8224519-Alexandrium_andersonii.AAC.1
MKEDIDSYFSDLSHQLNEAEKKKWLITPADCIAAFQDRVKLRPKGYPEEVPWNCEFLRLRALAIPSSCELSELRFERIAS